MLVPLLTLGLPSSATAAVLLAAFQQYGLQPGPLLFSSRPDLVWTLIASLYIGNVMLLVLNLPLAGVWARVMLVPRPLLFGGILVLASLGAYSLNRSLLDLALLYVVGVVGCAMRVYDVPLVPAVLGLVLGPLAEQQFRRAVAISEGDLSVFVTRPISAALLACRRPCCRSCSRRWLREAVGVDDATARLRRRRWSAAATPALCAALTAREAGARVVVARARAARTSAAATAGTRATSAAAHDAPTDVLTDAYPKTSSSPTCCASTADETDEALARLVDPAVGELPRVDGARRRALSAALRGTLHLARTNAFFLGGGKALMNSYYAAAERLGIDVRLRRRGRRTSISRTARFESATCGSAARGATIRAGVGRASRPAASRRTSSGCARPGATPPTTSSSAARRTTPARCCELMLDAGAQPVGDPRECHAVAVDARAPKFDGGIVTRLDCVPLGIVVNRHGRAVLRRGRGLLAEALRDLGNARSRGSPSRSRIRSSMPRRPAASCRRCFRRSSANSIRELARQLEPAAGRARGDRRRRSTAPCAPARSTTRRSTTAAPRG